ncbi:hypothetical protein [Opitutus sp. ER46]|uniref:hypothetical protein n=1 Tax=Opitutus sp. ER46 TaxID=2161864 RepID=UPI000D320C30|nr:hypothetical protein [Opitutus sp. ER46]PTX95746.1 hypothetical protein DB354_10065 [Opitutus sp. ER46]
MSTSLVPTLSSETITLPTGPRFSIPLDDLAEFSALAEARRTEVRFTLQLLERLHALRGEGNITTAAQVIAANHRHQMRGCSASSLLRKYYLYLGSVTEVRPQGDWRCLVAQYKGPSFLSAKQQTAFDEFVKQLAEDNHRSMAEAWELLRTEIWPSGKPIPGYGSWIDHWVRTKPTEPLPKCCPRGFFPIGWSKRNLYRKAPNKGARVLFQRGIAAAKRYFPSITRDPSQLRPLELIAIDDFNLDTLCVFPGDSKTPPQIAPVAGLLAKDVATRRNLVWGIGAQVQRDERMPDGSVRKVRCGIRRVDVQTLLHALFAKFGLPDYPVTILCENATASISAELELALSTLFEGRVRVERTGLINHRLLTNGFCEKGGKPWEKGWIESAFNSLWNKLGAMPGYKGNNQRLHSPAGLDDAIRYTNVLIGQGDGKLNLPPEKIALLRLPFPSPEAVERAFAWACNAYDTRTDHKYIGFDQVTEFCLTEGSEPRPFSELALVPVAQQASLTITQRPEAPIERWQRLAATAHFRPIPPAMLALLLLTPKKVTYRNHQITFAHDKIGYTYVDESGTILGGVTDGAEFLGYLDTAAPEQLHLTDTKGAYVGTLNRLGGKKGAIDIRDKDALQKASAVTATILNRAVAELRERHSEQDQQLALDKAHNDAIRQEHVAATGGLSSAEKIALAAGENRARAIQSAAAAKRAERGISAQAASNALADLLPES